MPQVFVALGANLAEPKAQLDQACAALQALDSVSEFQVSPYYTSAPMAGSALIDDQLQPEYVNAVCTFHTALPPLALLDQLQAIENEQGRIRAQRWGRTWLRL